ncbi:uncharacterized protein B0H18DRAFT_1087835 [Fomitopsis serialis]|uniref:uncharacterized protein n=1 Tax=Fomitopsis serialis TaxID=139415 RepID=UPI002007BDBC|nr:uncharacterized protein B0H18DRAFT_1087835 [Neoantrodia serialis]KAH9914351.1 hypothetical protein B0H18DRAFT_1087835 [Neoantrodia serialis]
MGDIPSPEVANADATAFHTRGYQQELLEASLRSNIIIALGTGSGKTHIAVLRMKHEAEREPRKVSWFLAPTVGLLKQQFNVICKPSRFLYQWKDQALWRRVLESHRIIVSTPQVLLDALRHGYVDLGIDIGLLVYDEAHHAIGKDPYNMIMKDFYFSLDKRGPDSGPNIERNLDSTICSSHTHQEELDQCVHRPDPTRILYHSPSYDWDTLPSQNILSLRTVVDSLDIENDPHVKSLRGQLARAQSADERQRIDQRLSETIHKADTFTHQSLRDFWAADWYIVKVIEHARRAANPHNNITTSWRASSESFRYLLDNLDKVNLVPIYTDPDAIQHTLTPKVRALIACLVAEKKDFRPAGETYSGLIFVKRRNTVIALAEVLSRLPETAQLFRIGCLLGSSSNSGYKSSLDITQDPEIVKESQANTLQELREGKKDLLVSTSACNCVVCFDAPTNMVSWVQSRGRARRQRSSFIMMLEQDSRNEQDIQKWIDVEEQMTALDTDLTMVAPENFEDDDDLDERTYRVGSTGAVLTLDSATSHLNHFAAVLSNVAYDGQLALYDLDPPDYPEGWHLPQGRLKDVPLYQGPWGATVTLPRCLPAHLRKFSTPREHRSKRLAQKHAAFNAYVALHDAKLLNDHLQPLISAIESNEGEVKELLLAIEKRAGTEKVSSQMDPWALKANEETWWKAEMIIDGLPALTMLTPNPLPPFAKEEMPTIYIPGTGATHVSVRPMGKVDQGKAYLERARTYSHRMFSTLYFARMKPDDRAFAYLFLPAEEGPDEHSWEDRRKWMQERIDRGADVRLETNTRANADMLRQQYGLPTDLALIRPNEKFGKPLQFVRWFNGPLSAEDEDKLRERYDGFPDATTTHPLLQVKEFPQRANFLAPLASDTAGLGREEAIYLLPKYTTVELVSKEDLQYAMWMSNALTVVSLRDELLPADTVSKVAFDLLRIAITAPVAQEMMDNEQPRDYQRLEMLGDCVLKCLTSTQLFADHPSWPEAKAAIEKGLHKWIIRDRFVPRKWKPRYLLDSVVEEPEPESEMKRAEEGTKDEGKKRKKKQTQELSTKVLADVVEALIGAAYEHGGFDLAVECVATFGLGLSWKKLTTNINDVLRRHEELDVPPPRLSLVERMIGYGFKRKALLVQALTHASYNSNSATMSYERLEFLGDCVLDMIDYKPVHMHRHKEALVNSHFLAYFCLKTFTTCESLSPSWSPTSGLIVGTEEQRIYLWQYLLYSSHRMPESSAFLRFEEIGPEIEKALKQKTIYPWAALTRLQAPKFLSDMIESLLGAVFLDSEGDFTAARNVLGALGIMDVLERIVVRDEMDVLHPVSRLKIWAAQQKPQQTVELAVEPTEGNEVRSTGGGVRGCRQQLETDDVLEYDGRP